MYKCVLWGTGAIFSENINLIRYYEVKGDLQIIAVTSKDGSYNSVLGYKWCSKQEMSSLKFDIVIVMTTRNQYISIVQEAENMGIAGDKIIPYDVFQRPEMNVEKYLQLKKSPPTIFANNCMGGLTYHSLGMQFASPMINMYMGTKDYLKLLKMPKAYMNASLEWVRTEHNQMLNIDFPVVRCKDILLFFNHYTSFEQAREKWESRKKRIDWDDIVVMMYTEDRALANEFLKLPYRKKICFVSFETEEQNLCYINCKKTLWEFVNAVAARKILYYDDIALLSDGEIKMLCK